jgi:superfamily I DNA/RNA helicase
MNAAQIHLALIHFPVAGVFFSLLFQGSSASCVFLKMERTAYMSDEEFRRWLYTAVTRAEKELVIIA